MADWKSGLRQAADQLGLSSKPKDRAAVPVSVPVSIRPVSRVPDERPAVPRMPDYPTGSSGNAAPAGRQLRLSHLVSAGCASAIQGRSGCDNHGPAGEEARANFWEPGQAAPAWPP